MTACPRCGEPAEVTGVAETAMQSGDVVVRVAGLARSRCAAGHDVLVPATARSVVPEAIGHQLLAATTRGVVRRREVCGGCGAELVLPPVRTERAVPVDVDGRVLTIVVGAPMSRCPDCGREQLVPAAAGVVGTVATAAVDAADG